MAPPSLVPMLEDIKAKKEKKDKKKRKKHEKEGVATPKPKRRRQDKAER